MGTIADKLTYLNETKTQIKDNLNFGGANITNETFREYADKIKDLYVYFMNNGLEVVWNNWEKVIGSGTTITLNQTMEAPIKIDLKGNTSQTGTPTPTSPQPINITTGRQVVRVINKNLAEWETTQDTSKYTYSSFTAQDISVEKTATGGSFYASFILHIPTAGTYYLKGNNSSNQQFYIYTDRLWGTLKESFSVSATGDFTRETAFNSAGDYIIGLYGSALGNYSVKNFMCTTISDTTYEEYKGNDYEINLGKNLFDVENATFENGYYSSDGNYISANQTITFDYIDVNSSNNYILSVKNNMRALVITEFDTNKAFIRRNIDYNKKLYTITTTSTTKYIRLTFNKDDVTTMTRNIVEEYEPLFEIGNTASSFTPYKTPIYLGKIGTYQDYIFRNTTENPLYDSNLEEGQWYIHKEIGRVVFNGSEDWNAYDTTYKRLNLLLSDASTISARTMCYSNYFEFSSSSNDVGTCFTYGGRIYLYPTLDINTTALFQTWLSSHNTEVYYILNTPTTTLIEDYELIYQLNELEKAKSYDNTTNILQSNDNLPFILDVRALKKI